MGKKDDKTGDKKLSLFKGGKKRDIYGDAKWKKRPIDMDGETTANPNSFSEGINMKLMIGEEIRRWRWPSG